jgi:hypothetical protein
MREGASSFRQFFRVSAFCGLFWVAVPGLFCAGGEEPPATVPSIESAFVSTKAQVTTMPDAVWVPVEWKYTNLWDFPLLVERFEESCGCLGGVADKQAVAPGASGVIRANFAPGGYRGKVRKSLHVRFVGFNKPVELVAEVTVPSGVEISSQELVWEQGAKPSPKTVDVKAGTDADFTITGLAGVPDGKFTLTQETITPGRHYRITATPTGNADPAAECLQVRTDSADLRDRVLAVFLRTGANPVTVPSP